MSSTQTWYVIDVLSRLNRRYETNRSTSLSDLGATFVVASRWLPHGGILWRRQHARRRRRVQGWENLYRHVTEANLAPTKSNSINFVFAACWSETATRLFCARRSGPVGDKAAAAEEPVGTLLVERRLVRQERHLDAGTQGVTNG